MWPGESSLSIFIPILMHLVAEHIHVASALSSWTCICVTPGISANGISGDGDTHADYIESQSDEVVYDQLFQ